MSEQFKIDAFPYLVFGTIVGVLTFGFFISANLISEIYGIKCKEYVIDK